MVLVGALQFVIMYPLRSLVAAGMPLVCPGGPQWALEGSGGALLGLGGPWRALVFPVGLWWALVGASRLW